MEINKETIKMLKEDWTAQNYPLGLFLGYPECCIQSFCDQPPALMMGLPSEADKKRLEASYVDGIYTGFIPCKKHAEQILKGEITLKSLIGKRLATFKPFPHE